MGTRGPIPKRSEEKMGHRTKAELNIDKIKAAPSNYEIPEPDIDWHPIASQWYLALDKSAQTKFFEPSDWAFAFYIAEGINRNLRSKVFSGNLLAVLVGAMNDLLTTEGSRRRVKLEIEREVDDPSEDEARVYDLRARAAR